MPFGLKFISLFLPFPLELECHIYDCLLPSLPISKGILSLHVFKNENLILQPLLKPIPGSLLFCSISEFSTCHMSVCSSQVLRTHFIFCFHPCNSHPVTHQVFLVSYSKYKQTLFLKTPVAINCTQGIHSLLLTQLYSLSAFHYYLTIE